MHRRNKPLTLLHSEGPKCHRVFAILRAVESIIWPALPLNGYFSAYLIITTIFIVYKLVLCSIFETNFRYMQENYIDFHGEKKDKSWKLSIGLE